ncbi:methionine ABC transporter permease [Fundicoccus sp. Sow4_D5]|uniref:methionine ABC transporter permease n=1 Tax=unclassified Fundicoccus TaxID=2761543 RepID=UPI003F93EB0B
MTQLILSFNSFMEEWLPHAWPLRDGFIEATWETLYMLGLTIVAGGTLGLILGVIITVTGPNGILPNQAVFKILDALINVFRSIPFIILLALLVNVTRLIVGTTIGATAATVPIVIGTIPFFARQVEIALLEVDPGVVEAAQAMGSSPFDIIYRVYLREGLPALLRVSASTVINVIGLTAMAGAVGGGGLGTMAIARGYQRSRMDVILVSTVLILIIVFVSQLIFNWLIRKVEH